MSLTVTYRPPFELTPVVRRIPEGATLLDIRKHIGELPNTFDQYGSICIAGHVVPRALWGSVRPRPLTHDGHVVEVSFHATPSGGDDDGGKNILAIVASIAITAAAGFIAGGGLATAGGLFAKGSVSATLLAAGVSLAGSLLLSALAPPPTLSQPESRNTRNLGSAGADGNILDPNGGVPRVVGTHKVFPPLGCEPLTYYDGEDEVVEAVYVLAGPHELTDIRIAEAPIDEAQDVEFETREGFGGSDGLTLISRQGRAEPIQSELRGHTVSETDGRLLESFTDDEDDALPPPTTVATRQDPDEVWINLTFPQGIHRNASETDRLRVPIRIRFRQVGTSTWINGPELHFEAAKIAQMRASIAIAWQTGEVNTASAANQEGWTAAHTATPLQTALPSWPGYEADPYFQGTGDTYINSSNGGTSGVKNVIMNRYEARLTLDVATFPKGRYEFELQRGYSFGVTDFVDSTYLLAGQARSLFHYEGTGSRSIYQTRDGISDALFLIRATSVWNENPITTDDLAMIAIRARNRRVERVSTIASGYVRDWDGSAWTDWKTTSNPAPHLRDIYGGLLNVDPVPVEIIDDDSLSSWRQRCIDEGYECNAVVQDVSVLEAASIVSACGFARPYMSEIWGVTPDYDRTAEAPVQLFSPRNTSGFGFTKAFADLPDGFRVTFADRDQNYDTRQVVVFRDGVSDDSGLVEQVAYEGLVTEAQVRLRASFDLLQARLRSAFFTLTAPAEAIVCRRGSLVAVQHDMLSRAAGQGRIVSVQPGSAGFLTSITLDDEIPLFQDPDISTLDLAAAGEFSTAGQRTGCVIRRSNNTITTHELTGSTGDTRVLTFTSEISDAGIASGDLVLVGPLQSEVRRAIVFAMTPQDDLTAEITMVDEAPEIWANAA
ncbi:MAG: phage tail protein [Pseudomonadota bacterium]